MIHKLLGTSVTVPILLFVIGVIVVAVILGFVIYKYLNTEKTAGEMTDAYMEELTRNIKLKATLNVMNRKRK